MNMSTDIYKRRKTEIKMSVMIETESPIKSLNKDKFSEQQHSSSNDNDNFIRQMNSHEESIELKSGDDNF